MGSKKEEGESAAGGTRSLRDLGLESFEMVKIHRSQLKEAEYNPRLLGEAEKRKLRQGIKRHGMVAPITWNARTGRIVGGHQRIAQLDALAGTPDYELTVARIDVDESREKEINLLLNNSAAQGDWDLEALSKLVKDPTLDLVGMGFDHADLYRLFGDTPIEERNEQLDELAQKVREARDRYNAIEEKNKSKNATEFYCLLIFRSSEQLNRFFEVAKLPDNRYQSGEEIASRLGVLDKLSEGAS
jgi:hypothetical protein